MDPSPAPLDLPPLTVKRLAPPRTRLGRWLAGGPPAEEPHAPGSLHPWYRVLWLTGVDYFSTLGYQPGIALLAAGALSPVATLLLVGVTLLGALPVYAQVARRSYAGQGSIAMLENLLTGWKGKLVVLGLLGFASTDFVITMTLSAADAAQHAVENPFLHPVLGEARLELTLLLLAALAAVFLMGFSEAIGLAAFVTVPYLLLNAVVIGTAGLEILRRPDLLSGWSLRLLAAGDPAALLLASAIIFPKLALGLSGFETGVSVMPLVSGGRGPETAPPAGRIRATRKMLASAALIMSVMLIGSSLVTTLLVPEAEVVPGGAASGRALAWLAHRHLGHGFGTLYDLSTLTILWFAGASAMAGMLHLIPRYLPRFGMAPRWVGRTRPLVLALLAADVLVTLAFDAEVEAQSGAYATGVLVLMLSGAAAVALAFWREAPSGGAAGRPWTSGRLASLYFWGVTLVFAFTLVDNVVERPDGVIIASVFIAAVLILSALSRWIRSTELRVERMSFADEESRDLWPHLVGKKVHLVPVRSADPSSCEKKRQEVHRHYKAEGAVAFVSVDLMDNRSEFLAPLRLTVRRYGGDFVLSLHGAVAVANSLAYLSELVDPKGLFLTLTRRNPMLQAFDYLLWGEGEIGLSLYTILIRYWESTPEEDVRPLIFLMSE